MYFSNSCTDALTQSSMMVCPLPPFLNTYMSSIECKDLCIVINFLVLWFICLGSSFVHFIHGPVYLTMETPQVFIPLIRFLLSSFFSRTLFWFFLLSLFIWWCPFPIFQRTYNFPSLQEFWCFPHLAVLFFPLFLFFLFSLSAWHTFHYQIPFLYLGCRFL